MADPQCGTLSEQDGTPGTEIDLHGSDFYPNTETTLLWEDSIGNEFRHREAGEFVAPVTDQEGVFSVSLIMPYRLLPPSVGDDYTVWRLTAFQGEPVEEADPFRFDLLLEHFYISVVGGAIGIGMGVVLGYLLARIFYSLIQSKLALRSLGFFIPSRTILVALLMILIFPVFLIVQFGFRARTGSIGTAMVILILSVSFSISIFLWKWESSSIASQLISGGRTLAALSVFFTTWLGYFGLGGVTLVAVGHLHLLRFDLALQYFLAIIVLLLLLDLLGGAIAFLLHRREEKSNSISS